MKRPLMPAACCYVFGLIIGWVLEPAPLPCLWIGAGILALALSASRFRAGMVLLLFCVLGAAHYGIETRPLAPHDLRRALTEEPVIATIRGQLLEPPTLRIYPMDDERVERSLVRVAVSAVRRGGEWEPARGTIVALARENLEGRFHQDQRLEITGVLARPDGPRAPGLFDYRAFLANQRVHFVLRTDDPRDWKIASDNTVTGPGFSERFIARARQWLSRGLPPGEAVDLLQAMTLGWRAALTDEVSEPFMRSGTLHIFAISGLHVALITGILVRLAILVRVPRRWCCVPVLLLIWFYAGATGWQSSAVRSTIMMSVILLGWALNRPPDLLNSLFVAALCILVWEPLQLFQASFQLSFCVVLSLAILLPPMEHWCRKRFEPDPLLPHDLRAGWRRATDPALRWLASSSAMSCAAWLGSLPLTAYYFHLLTPGSLLANLLIVPLSGFALMAVTGSLLCGAWLPAISDLFNHAAWFFMSVMIAVSHWFAEIPGFSWFVPSPSRMEVACFYGFILLSGAALIFHQGRSHARLAGILLLLLTTSLAVRAWKERAYTRIAILPLNGGHAIHVDAPGKKSDLLIDCGDGNTYRMMLRPYLRAQGINTLPRIALTHGDVRHVGGAIDLVKEFSTSTVLVGPTRFRSPVYREVENSFKQYPGLWRVLSPGDTAVPWTMLHPEPTDRQSHADDASLVLHGTIFGWRVLLLGDLGRAGQTLLLRRHGDSLNADIVITGLPTNGEPLNNALIEAVSPRIIIVADTEFPATARAPSELVSRLHREGIQVYFTRRTGSLSLHLRNESIQIRTTQAMEHLQHE